MKINWKVRFNNPIWQAQVVLAIITPILTYLGLTVKDLTSWSILGDVLVKAISNPYVLGCVVVSLFGTITDPTTVGINDSDRAMTYEVPKE